MVIQDLGRAFAASWEVDGYTTIFDLPNESISSTVVPPTVLLGGIVQDPNHATPSYSWDYKYGQLIYMFPPGPPGTLLQVTGWTYDFFTDLEVAEAVNDAFSMHTQDYDPPFYLDPMPGQMPIPVVEEILVAYLAAIELLWFRATDASQEIDVHTPEGVLIPRSQRWNQITNQIQGLQNQYNAVSAALGVGLNRFYVLNQRRVSYTTNRLVPLFKSQEYNQPYTGFEPTAAPVGSIITITGKYFSTATTVSFGGVPATQFIIVDDEHIQATVPVGAKTGQIGITTPTGSVLSTAQFVVGQPAPYVLSGPEQIEVPIPTGT
jgi:hypothetical protein